MPIAAPTPELVRYLKNATAQLSGFERFKTVYRPQICPFDELLGEIPAGARVFDVGCGGGAFLLLAARFARPAALMGVDVDERAIRRARALLAPYADRIHVDVQVYAGGTFPPALHDADCVFLIDVLHHVRRASKSEFLQSLHDAMAPRASLVVKDIDRSDRFLCLCNKLHDLALTGHAGDEVSAEEARALATSRGFDVGPIRKRRMTVYSHFWMTCTRA